jgi:phosphotransferase system  glucose/maltose/N-acetylglucosamine-specific IIC component
MNIFKKLNVKALGAFFVLNCILFYLIDFMYIKGVLGSFKDITAAAVDKPNSVDLHSPSIQRHVMYFDLWVFYKNLIIYVILLLVIAFLKLFKSRYTKEAFYAVILYIIISLTLNHFLPATARTLSLN